MMRTTGRVEHTLRIALLCVLSTALAACSVTDTMRDVTAVDYKRAGKGPVLDVPPDLTKPRGDDRLAIPGRTGSGTTFSEYSRERGSEANRAANSGVLPQTPGVRLERQGNQRWLVVDQPPDQVWKEVRDFWVNAGFALQIDSPATGILETDWAEKRPKVEDSWLRGQLSKALNSFYSTAERDKFRVRLESGGSSTEVYLTHRGMVEQLSGSQKESTVWVQRPSDPELEAEFLRRLMLSLGGTAAAPAQAGAAAAAMAAPKDRAVLVEREGRPQLELSDGFDRSWRQVGLALDRGGFTVEDRDRSQGTYFVRYVDPDQEIKTPGVFDRIFGSGAKKDLSGKRFRVTVNAVPGASQTRVAVLAEDGNPPANAADQRMASSITRRLQEQLR